MTNKGIDIKDYKFRGEWAELRFMARAAEHGLRVSKPFGECAPYDATVEHGGVFRRVQIKSTGFLRKPTEAQPRRSDSYLCGIEQSGGKAYTKDQVDFLAVYIIQCDLWYIFPVEVLGGARGLTISPQLANSKHAPYKEAWHLLCGEAKEEDSACAENCGECEIALESPQAEAMRYAEARFREIRERLLAHPCFKYRR